MGACLFIALKFDSRELGLSVTLELHFVQLVLEIGAALLGKSQVGLGHRQLGGHGGHGAHAHLESALQTMHFRGILSSSMWLI